MFTLCRRSHIIYVPEILPCDLPRQTHSRRRQRRQRRRKPTDQKAAIFRHPASKKQVYLSWYLARRGRLDENELGLEKVGPQVLMATLDEIRPHRIALKSRVILESPRAQMLSQYLCGTETPDSAHIIHEIQIRDKHGEMQRVRALIDCGATSVFMAPRLLKRLGISHEAAHTTTLGLGGQIMLHAKES